MGLSRIVSGINGGFSRKSQTFPTQPRAFRAPPAERVPLGIWYRCLGLKKLYQKGLERSLAISAAVWIQYNVTDRRTDGHRTTWQRPRLRIASRGTNARYAIPPQDYQNHSDLGVQSKLDSSTINVREEQLQMFQGVNSSFCSSDKLIGYYEHSFLSGQPPE